MRDGSNGLVHNHFAFRIEIKNALAGIAHDDLLPGAYFVVGLRPQHDLARDAFVITDFGEPATAEFRNPLVVPEPVGRYATAQAVALGIPLGQLLFVLCRYAACIFFFLLDFGRLGLELGLGDFDVFFTRLGVDHQFEDLVLIDPDFLLSELNFVKKGLVLLVGFYVEGLVAVFRNFRSQVDDRRVELLPRGIVGFDRCAGFLDLCLSAG